LSIERVRGGSGSVWQCVVVAVAVDEGGSG
jgi:hypothetical protein